MGLRTTGSLAKRLILAPSGRINASSCALIDVSGILVKPRCPKVMVNGQEIHFGDTEPYVFEEEVVYNCDINLTDN